MGFAEDFKTLIKIASETQFNGPTDLAIKAGAPQSSVSQLNSNKRKGLQLETVGKLLDTIGVKIMHTPDGGGRNSAYRSVFTG